MASGFKGKKKYYLEKGLAKIHKATEADKANELSQALTLYFKGVGHLYNSLQYDDHTKEEKKSLHTNYVAYKKRVDELEREIDKQKRSKKEQKRNSKKEKKSPLFKFQQNGSFDDEDGRRSKSSSAPNTPRLNRHATSPPPPLSTARQAPPLSNNSTSSVDPAGNPSTDQYAKPVRAVPPTSVASVRPLPPIPPVEEEKVSSLKGDYLLPNDDFPPFKSATLKRRVPPPVPNTPRPVLFNGCATVGRQPKNKSTLLGSKEPLSTSPSFPLMSKQVAQVHRAPETHSTGTLLRIHDKYIKPNRTSNTSSTTRNTRDNSQQQHSTKPPSATAAVVGKQKKPFANLDSETLLANAQTIISMATKEDLQGNYKGALQKYEDAVKLFYYILREYKTVSVASQESIRSHCVLYQDRIETLKGMLAHLKPCRQISRTVDDVQIREEYKNTITTDKANINLNSVAGHDDAKELFISTILSPIKFPQAFSVNAGQIPRNILLYGPPGCGKTYLVKALACEAKQAAYFYVKACDLVSQYLSDAVRLIEVLFEKAREHSPSIIIIDDLEYLEYNQNGSEDVHDLQKQQLAFEIRAEENMKGVYVIGTTNKPWKLDSSIKQCFDRSVGVTLPDLPSRVKILNSHLKMISHSINERQMLHVAHHTDGFSGADISTLLHDALMQPVYRLQQATHFRQVRSESLMRDVYAPCHQNDVDSVAMTLADMDTKDIQDPCLSYDDVKVCLESTRSSVTSADLLKFTEYQNNFR